MLGGVFDFDILLNYFSSLSASALIFLYKMGENCLDFGLDHRSSSSNLVSLLQRLLIVPPELAYGSKGVQEIPPNATIEVNYSDLFAMIGFGNMNNN